jgi:hypothetical protein
MKRTRFFRKTKLRSSKEKARFMIENDDEMRTRMTMRWECEMKMKIFQSAHDKHDWLLWFD